LCLHLLQQQLLVLGLSLNGGIPYNPATDILTTTGLAVTATTAAGSTSTGALIVTGGAGIGGSLWVGGPVSIGGTLDYATTNLNSELHWECQWIYSSHST
jgi:hypothetical protein